MRLLKNLKFPNLQSGEKYAYLEAFMSGPAETAGLGGLEPSSLFEKSMLQRKRKKDRKKK